MGRGKYLLIKFDEEWMWELVVREFAKSYKELVLKKRFFKACHKNHINKVMMTVFTAIAFEDSLEKGGEAIKFGMFRAQSNKVAKKLA